MGFETARAAETAEVCEVVPLIGGGRAAAARRGTRLCLACGERRALFAYRGVVKADRAHNLCFRCYRAEVNRLSARRMSAAPAVASPRPQPSRAVADRAALLADIAARRRRAQIIARHALEEPATVRAAALAS
jgi:hypothetical protein